MSYSVEYYDAVVFKYNIREISLRFTKGVKKVLANARKEMVDRCYENLWTASVLYWLLSDEGVIKTLSDIGVDVDVLRQKAEDNMNGDDSDESCGVMYDVIKDVASETDGKITPNHFMLGLLSCDDVDAYALLTDFGVTHTKYRNAMEGMNSSPSLDENGNVANSFDTVDNIDPFRFGFDAIKVLKCAQEMARESCCANITTEHVLLSLLESGNFACTDLLRMGVDIAAIKQEIKRDEEVGSTINDYNDIPFSSATKIVLANAVDESKARMVTTRDILCGLLKYGRAASHVLTKYGATYEKYMEMKEEQDKKGEPVKYTIGMINAGDFTESVKSIFQYALDRAHVFRHESVRLEHVLLGLIETDSWSRSTLKRMGVDIPEVKKMLLDRMAIGNNSDGEYPFSPEVDKALYYAVLDANGKLVHTDHIMHGVLHYVSDEMYSFLAKCGLTYRKFQKALHPDEAEKDDAEKEITNVGMSFMNVGMSFMEAIKHVVNGKKVRRPTWLSTAYCCNQLEMHDRVGNTRHILTIEDYDAADWEIIEEKPKTMGFMKAYECAKEGKKITRLEFGKQYACLSFSGSLELFYENGGSHRPLSISTHNIDATDWYVVD
jgi:ATP-dependent Clp protease ATP-binding subunit ClpA